MKFGFDLHGVLDTNPAFFSEFTEMLIYNDHEVHIITGPKRSQKILDWLRENKICWTHFFSITDYHESIGTKITWDEKGNPHMESYLWDKSKGEYCQREGIDLHFDDSESYGYFFKTPYARFFSKDTNRMRKIQL